MKLGPVEVPSHTCGTLGRALLLLLTESPALGAPLDVDGDGNVDQVSVSADGQVVAALTGGKLKAAIDAHGVGKVQASVEVVGEHRLLIVRADSTDEDLAHVGAVFEWRSGALDRLWQGSVGPQGPDEEWSVVLEAGDSLLLYEQRDEVSRCDGEQVRLFLKRFDFSAGRFLPVSPKKVIPDGATTLK